MPREDRKNPLLYLFGKTWKYSEGNRRTVLLYLLMFTLSECVDTFWMPIVLSNMMNIVVGEGITRESLHKLFLLLLLFPLGTILSWSFHGPARLMEEANAFMARANYKKFLLQGVMNMPLEWHVDHHSGDTIDRIEKGTSSLYEFSSITFQFIRPIVKLLGCFGAVVYFSNLSAVIVIVTLVLGAWITVKIDSICAPQIRELSRQENKISESIFDSVSNISTVIILRVEKLVFDSIIHKVMEPFGLFKKNNYLNEWKWFLTSLCCSAMTVLVLGLYFYQEMNSGQKVAVGSVYLMISYLDRISGIFYDFTSLYGWTIRRKFRLMNGDELTNDFIQTTFANHVLPNGWREFEIRNLSFSYGNSDDPNLHLDDVSMTIRHGERIAFVGHTGSGKTTLLKIIRDLYHPKSGQLFVDGVEVVDGFEGISRAISLVPQNPEIFSTTILDNITLGAEYSEDEVRRFTDMACFTSVALDLPKGLLSSIKEKGVNLSGGQAQRLALSRGLLASHNKDIVLLDEPTSSLDFATEMEVYGNIFQGFAGNTIISSIHRLHLLPMFDRIYMFEKGRIVGVGTLHELVRSCPEFALLWNKQHELGM